MNVFTFASIRKIWDFMVVLLESFTEKEEKKKGGKGKKKGKAKKRHKQKVRIGK